jgi:hypothetical protein
MRCFLLFESVRHSERDSLSWNKTTNVRVIHRHFDIVIMHCSIVAWLSFLIGEKSYLNLIFPQACSLYLKNAGLNLSLFAYNCGLILLRSLFKFGAHCTAIALSYWNTRI